MIARAALIGLVAGLLADVWLDWWPAALIGLLASLLSAGGAGGS